MKKIRIREWYKKTIGILIPEYGALPLISCFLVNISIYWGTQLIMRGRYHYDLTSGWDNKIPFIKEWVIVYLACYVFWVVNYILVTHEEKETLYKFVFAEILAKFICGIIFVILPTTNIRPAVSGNDIFSWLMRFVYDIDIPSNLFPSIHCLVSWFCFIGIRRSKRISLWYKVFSCIFAILVFLSTQFTKQHYLIDIAGGIIISELCYFIACHTRIYLSFEKFFLWANRKIFGADTYNE